MLRIDKAALRRTAKETGWDLQGHVDHVYDTFRFDGGKAPPLTRRAGDARPAIQQSLVLWNADLGARHRMDWRGFLNDHRAILKPLSRLPRLGRLKAQDIARVVEVVQALDAYKPTAGKKLVFGSKAAHFHFPGLVPVTSSEVSDGLRGLERTNAAELHQLTGSDGPHFRFSSPETNARSYENYLTLGNHLMADVDSVSFLGRMSSATYDLHAKILEWWVISQRARS